MGKGARLKRERRQKLKAIHLLVFDPWDVTQTADDTAPNHAVAFAQLRAAFMLPTETGGQRMGDGNDDLLSAIALGNGFDKLSDPKQEGRLRPEGGYLDLTAHAMRRLRSAWSRPGERGGPAGYRALLGDSRYKIIAKVEKYLDSVQEMTPDEFADWKAGREKKG